MWEVTYISSLIAYSLDEDHVSSRPSNKYCVVLDHYKHMNTDLAYNQRKARATPDPCTKFSIGRLLAPLHMDHLLQEKEQLVFEGTVGRDMEALGRLTEDDLRFPFG